MVPIDARAHTKRVLLLGGCGYIGSRLGPYLRRRGHFVQSVDVEWFGNFSEYDNWNMDFCALTREQLDMFDVIVVLAGHSSVKLSEKQCV